MNVINLALREKIDFTEKSIINESTENQSIKSESPNNNDISSQTNNIDNNIINIINNTKNIKNYFKKYFNNEIINNNLEIILFNLTNRNKEDFIIKEKDILYQITSSENQNNKEYRNISKIILGQCENILKKEYEIDDNQTLIIFKIDYYKSDSLIPIIGYEIFDQELKQKLDLNYCKNENININLSIPVAIDEENLYKYDPNNEYYKDDCIPSSTESGTDILVNDRKNEYNQNNLAICEKDCIFIEYKNNLKRSICDCKIKPKQINISEIENKTDLLSYNFSEQDLPNTLSSMKCLNTLFSKNGFLYNIESYILIFIVFIFMFSGIFFCKSGYPLIESDINEILYEKKREKNVKEDKNNFNTSIKIKKTKIKSNKKTKNKNKKYHNDTTNKSSSKLKKNKNLNLNNIRKENMKTSNGSDVYKKFIDYELNTFPYQTALINDKRTFFQYYISLIRKNHPLLFSFCPNKDYNVYIFKFNLFFLSFSFYYFINSLFFNGQIIHEIYADKGHFKFIYLLPYILLSFFISYILSLIVKFIFLSERNIYEIKLEKSIQKANDKAEKVKKILVVKYIIFFIVGSIYLLLSWYFLSSFGAVYQNTQIYLIKSTLMSFGISLVYPLVFNFIPTFLRISSLKKGNIEFVYKISKYLQNL